MAKLVKQERKYQKNGEPKARRRLLWILKEKHWGRLISQHMDVATAGLPSGSMIRGLPTFVNKESKLSFQALYYL
jgi:hypothetical protein